MMNATPLKIKLPSPMVPCHDTFTVFVGVGGLGWGLFGVQLTNRSKTKKRERNPL